MKPLVRLLSHAMVFVLVLFAAATTAQNVTVNTFDHRTHTGGATITETFAFPTDISAYSEILMHFQLTCPPGGCDPWDRFARLGVIKDGVHYEIGRYITPYANGNCSWTLDVSAYRWLLQGQVELQSHIETWSKGWDLTVDFEFVAGTPEYTNTMTRNVYVDYGFIYGDTLFWSVNLPELEATLPPGVEKAVLRVVNTGHGQGNYQNAAEFSHQQHNIKVNGNVEWTQDLWKADCGQNPCGPQPGTWTGSRAGWCPGQEVNPTDYDLTSMVSPGQLFTVDYVLQPYFNFCSPWNPNCDLQNDCMSFAGECNYNSNTHTQPIYKMSVQMLYYSNNPITAGQFWATGVEAERLADNIRVYPNPSSGQFSLEMPQEDFYNARAEVLSMTGSVVASTTFAGVQRNAWRFSIEDQPQGVYLLRIETASGTFFKKLIKTQ